MDEPGIFWVWVFLAMILGILFAVIYAVVNYFLPDGLAGFLNG